METVFPFGFEPATQFYLVLYLLTLVLHVFFMNYVLAGSIWLAWSTLFPGRGATPRAQQPLALILRDWLPFVLSAAITAAVAPLLFLQIIYPEVFYTANLLLGWRWMVVIPVLITAFYLLYVLKSRMVTQWSFTARCTLGAAIAGCFIFIAFCWTANHLLSLNHTAWGEIYRTGVVVESFLDLLPRLATWISGAFPIMSLLAAWQLQYKIRHDESGKTSCNQEARRLALLSIGGLLIAGICGGYYVMRLEATTQSHLVGSMGMSWIALSLVGITLQIAGWAIQYRNRCFSDRILYVISAGVLATLLGTACLREIIRISRLDISNFSQGINDASTIGGFGLFLAFTIINTILIVTCLKIIRSRKRS